MKAKPCLIACSVLREEIERLVEQGDLDAELVFGSKHFHMDYGLLEKDLRQIIKKVLSRFLGEVILVCWDLCLSPNDEMKTLTEEPGVVKVDAQNCVDCLLGGKAKSSEADPDHDLLFLGPGMIGFFDRIQEKARQENIDEAALTNLFSGLKGIVPLDTLGEVEKHKVEIETMHTSLTTLETKQIGINNLKQILLEAIERGKRKTGRNP